MSDDDWPRLAEYVRRRRNDDLGVSRAEVAARGGPSDTILVQIEAGVPSGYRPSTFHKLDDGLGWERGSARRVLAGGEPVVRRSGGEPQVAAVAAALGVSPDEARDLIASLEVVQRILSSRRPG